MKDDDQILLVAAEQIRTRGPQAVTWLIEQAEVAEAVADHDAAKTWRDIAAVAEKMLRSHSSREDDPEGHNHGSG